MGKENNFADHKQKKVLSLVGQKPRGCMVLLLPLFTQLTPSKHRAISTSSPW